MMTQVAPSVHASPPAPSHQDTETPNDEATQIVLEFQRPSFAAQPSTSARFVDKRSAKDDPYDMLTQRLHQPTSGDDIYDLLTQEMPVDSSVSMAARDQAMHKDFNRIASASTPRRDGEAKRKSPDTQEDSVAKLIPKDDEPPMKRQKPSKKTKHKWLFVSSSDEEDASDSDENDDALVTGERTSILGSFCSLIIYACKFINHTQNQAQRWPPLRRKSHRRAINRLQSTPSQRRP